MKLLLAAMTVALAAGLLTAVGTGAAPTPNPNADTIVFDCDGTDVTVWLNFVASEVGGESPAIVVEGSSDRVFKVYSYALDGDVFYLRFPGDLPVFDLVTCTHPSPWGEVTLEGVFAPGHSGG